MDKQLAKIKRASLETKERGALSFWIHVDYEEGFSQGVGGYALDTYNGTKKSREGTAYGCEVIRRLLIELQVNDFSEMKGQQIWVLGEGGCLSFKPLGIQALKTNNSKSKPVIFEEIFLEMKEVK